MNADIQALLALENERQQALVAGDRRRLAPLLADDLLHIHSTGMAHSKDDFLEHVVKMGGFVAIERPTPEIRLLGDIAIISGETCNIVRLLSDGTEQVRHGYSTLVLRRTPQGWQIVLSQMTPFAA
ncbi:nuclear transport factor 2 family protein [Klebsiella oxytoca]|uniref:nuclear transport factor 2 family protein n=1 Tax=Klebsiella oxytoca TaxID=571 RepID=UPI00157A8C62|nr:nuclear transport factor 2 family protein [Klebsiella oxytoca]